MKTVYLFQGLDESTSSHSQSRRALLALDMRQPNLAESTRKRIVQVLESGQLEDVVDAMLISCPVCGAQIGPRELFLYLPSKDTTFIWNEESKHYVVAHDIITPELAFLMENVGK